MLKGSSFSIAVVADSHVPDRTSSLHPLLLPSLRRHAVQAVFHAGDISSRSVLDQLAEIAPVTAVRGNRDWLLRKELSLLEKIEIMGVKIALLHGHVNYSKYISDKLYHLVHGYHMQRYLPRLLSAWPEAQVVVFGHTHQPITLRTNGRFLFNPGSCATKSLSSPYPHYGILSIHPDGKILAHTYALKGYKLRLRDWFKEAEA